MIPVELRIRGFLSYKEEAVLDFTSFHTACISGHNGAGKSSLLDAMTWALFGRARRNDESVIHMQADTAQVAYTFGYEGNLYRIIRTRRRGKTTQLEFQIRQQDGGWKPLSERSLRDTEARIRSTLRLDYETFVNAAFFLQGKADSFTRMRPAERKRVLASILGLEQWEVYRRRALDKARDIENRMAVLQAQMEEYETELREESARKETLQQLERELADLQTARRAQEQALERMRQVAATLREQQKLVDALAGQVQSTRQTLETLERRLAGRREEQEARRQVLERAQDIEAAYQGWQQARAELERWEALAAQFREWETRRRQPLAAIQAERARLEQELRTLEAQEAEYAQTCAALEALEGELRQEAAALAQEERRLAERETLRERLQEIQEGIGQSRAENAHLKQEMAKLKERIDTLGAVEGGACPLCGQPLPEGERRTLLDHLEADGRRMGDRYRANQQAMSDLQQALEDTRARLQSLAALEREHKQREARLGALQARKAHLQEQKATWERHSAPRLEAVRRTLEEESFAGEARALLAEIDAQCRELGYDPAAHEAARQREQAGRAAEEALRQLESAKAALEPLEREIADLEAQIGTLADQLQTQQSEWEAATERLAAAQSQAPDVRQAERTLLEIQERENRLRMDVGAARQRVAVLDNVRERRREALRRRDELALEVSRYRRLEQAFGKKGVPALLIEAALPEIEMHANDMLERLSNGAMSVRFVTQRAYKGRRDDLKETLDIQIIDSAGMRAYEMYSGGEAFRVDFAVRLALARVLAARAGARLQTLVIDEGFGSQDAQGRQRLVEAINLIQGDFEKILVITHIESLKDAFPARIEVVKTPQGSTVEIRA